MKKFKYNVHINKSMKRGKFFLFGIVLILLSFMVSATCDDSDGDGYGINPSDCAFTDADCNDYDPSINPGATEIFNGIDDDCNGEIDDGVVFQCVDSDLDGFNTTAEHPSCVGGTCCGEIWDVDCDDSSALINPGLEEICGDGLDNDCDIYTEDICPNGEENTEPNLGGCTITEGGVYWADCNGEPVNTVNEGDSVYLIVATDRCSADSLVDFVINEDDTMDDVDYLTEEYYAYFEEDNQNVWAAGWIAAWLDDGTTEPNPEYEFTAKVITPDEGTFEKLSESLTVEKCPASNPNCGNECVLEGGFVSIGGRSARSGGYGGKADVACLPRWDCTLATWSECNPTSGRSTRDTSLCSFTGDGDQECRDASFVALSASKACSSNQYSQTVSSYIAKGDLEVEDECGDGICGDGENCPEDCVTESTFPWLLLFIIFILLVLVIGGVLYYFKLRGQGAAAKGKSPFTSINDERAVVNYIKMSKAKGVPDPQIKALLKKSGWSESQVAYSFQKLTKPELKPKPVDSAVKAKAANPEVK